MAAETNCDECSNVVVPLEEVFAALDLSLELVGQDSRLQSFRLNCRIYWCDDLVRFYSRTFSLEWLKAPNDLDGAWPPLADCNDCVVPELLPTSRYGRMNWDLIQPLDILGLANEGRRRGTHSYGMLEAFRCRELSCQRLYLCFVLDMDTLEASVGAFRKRLQLPDRIYFKVPRWEAFDSGMYEYHRINVDRQCTF